jgi:hypothetical protein
LSTSLNGDRHIYNGGYVSTSTLIQYLSQQFYDAQAQGTADAKPLGVPPAGIYTYPYAPTNRNQIEIAINKDAAISTGLAVSWFVPSPFTTDTLFNDTTNVQLTNPSAGVSLFAGICLGPAADGDQDNATLPLPSVKTGGRMVIATKGIVPFISTTPCVGGEELVLALTQGSLEPVGGGDAAGTRVVGIALDGSTAFLFPTWT